MGAHATGEQPQPESHRLNGKADLVRRSSQDAVRALQECIAAYVIEADEGDSQKFRWCHERYLHTASTLCTNIDEMHFEIAQIMVSGSDQQQYSEYCQAMHICQSVDLIRKRVSHRHLYRRALFRAAEQSTEAGKYRLVASLPWHHLFVSHGILFLECAGLGSAVGHGGTICETTKYPMYRILS